LSAAVVAVGLAGSGCTVVTNDEPLDGGFFDGNSSTPDETGAPTNACNECLFQQCAGSWAVCQNNQECLLIYACATKPGCDQQCINDCFCSHGAGQNTYVALAACDSYYTCNTCSSQCAPPTSACATPGVIARDICGTPPPPEDSGTLDASASDASTPEQDAAPPPTDAATVQDCTGCTNSKCSDEKAACGPNSECDQYAQCLAGCQDVACFNDCGTAHATGKAASQALENCTLTNCKAECGL
jgi:hypothetical protein